MKSISFFAAGEPKPQPRPRAFSFRGQARIYNPAQAESWKNCIASAAQPHIPREPLQGPVCVELTFYFVRPKNHYGTGKNAGALKPDAPVYHTSRGDRDNLDKAVLDCLQILGFFQDDGQVCAGEIKKLYATPPEVKPGCQIVIIPLEQTTETGLSARRASLAQPTLESGLELFAAKRPELIT